MKSRIYGILVFSFVVLLCTNVDVSAQSKSFKMPGAWQTEIDGNEVTMICSDQYFSTAIYDVASKRFVGTNGGSYRIDNGEFVALFEFNTTDPQLIGQEVRQSVRTGKKGSIVFSDDSGGIEWKRLDDGSPGQLAGAWLITGRMVDDTMQSITPGARRTMKILSGTRFQWIAYNVETREFSGTGGGTYTTRNGKYTETIEFFSRDSSRVGASLSFDFALESGNWRHKGLSSRGAPIDEIWTKREKIKL